MEGATDDEEDKENDRPAKRRARFLELGMLASLSRNPYCWAICPSLRKGCKTACRRGFMVTFLARVTDTVHKQQAHYCVWVVCV